MARLAEQIAKLSNPNPNFEESDEDYDDTAAKSNKPDGSYDTYLEPGSSSLRKRSAALLEEQDRRYSGKKVSRQKLLSDGYDFQVDSDLENDISSNSLYESGSDVPSEGESNEFDDIAQFNQELQLNERKRKISSSQESFTYESDNEIYSDQSNEGSTDGDEESEEIDDDDEAVKSDDEDFECGIQKFSSSSINDDVKKGIATKNQLSLWDSLLECRIKVQKCLLSVNQLPQPDSYQNFLSIGGDEYDKVLKKGQKAVLKLLNELTFLQSDIYHQNPETKTLGKSSSDSSNKPVDDDEEIPSDSDVNSEEEGEDEVNIPRKRMKLGECSQVLAKHHDNFLQYRNNTIQKWYDKTRVSSGKLSKGFSAFEQSALKQVEQIMSDKERLVKRTQLKRSNYRILGKVTEQNEKDSNLDESTKQDNLKSFDCNIFDDDDFYHQMLRELIERKTSDINDPVALSRHWLEIQKLRGKMKKKVDTRASKGRKIRYDVHKKLINFMAPMENSVWSDQAKDDLFSSLFDKRKEKNDVKEM